MRTTQTVRAKHHGSESEPRSRSSTGSTTAISSRVSLSARTAADTATARTSTRTSERATDSRDDWRRYTATGRLATSTAPGAEFGSLDRDFTLADFEKDPAYQTRLDEGYKGIERTAASRGGLDSGATGKALVRFGSDYAANEIDRSRTRFRENQTNRYNRWAGLSPRRAADVARPR
jgi:hypothetical protein